MLQPVVNQPLLCVIITDTERNLFLIYYRCSMWSMPRLPSTNSSRPWLLIWPHNMTHCIHATSWQTAVEIQVPLYIAVMFHLLCLFLRKITGTKQTHGMAGSKSRQGCNLHSLIPHISRGLPRTKMLPSLFSLGTFQTINSSRKSLVFCKFCPLRYSGYAFCCTNAKAE